jgi:predicted dehydrogenase
MQPVRIGVVGLGNFGQLHARTIAGLAEAELVALVDRSAERRDVLHQQLGAPAWADLASALDAVEADAWVVATQTDTHIELAEQILRRGASVLIEKPLSQTLASAERLAPLVAPESRNLMLGHILLFSNEVRTLLAEVAKHGSLAYFHAVRHRPTTTADLFAGESPMRLLMVHDLYVALAMMGGAEPEQIRGELRPRPGGGTDLAIAELRWPGNVWGTFTASFLTPPGMSGEGFDRFEVFGQGWAARLENNPRPLTVWHDRATWPLLLDINADPQAPSGWLAEELRHFCRVVRGKASVPFGARYADGLQIMRWLDLLEQN